MYDTIQKIGKSTIQHGKNNNRIYLMKLDRSDYPALIKELELIAAEKLYTKIVAKIPAWAVEGFQKAGYLKEAQIPNLYNGKTDALFFSKFIDHSRSFMDTKERELIDSNIKLALQKQKEPLSVKLEPFYNIRKLQEKDIPDLVKLYFKVFMTYPFPIFDEKFIKKSMDENVVYFGIFADDKLVAASSAEMDITEKNTEMTDFATAPDYQGKNLSLVLLGKMEQEMRKRNMKTLYTIARTFSPGMNITFARKNYKYSGTLLNNTNISGKIESMNIWHKNIQ